MSIPFEPNEKCNTQLARLWAEACPLLRSYVHSMVNNYEDGQDIVQQVAVRAAERFDTYDKERPFKYWAIGIAKNIILDYYKKTKRSPVVFVDPQSFNRYSEICTEEFDKLSESVSYLKKCIAKLTKRSRQLIDLRYARNLTHPQIADRLDTTAATIRVALFRIRVALKDCITKSITMESKGL